ncbi:MAG: Gfo/Idh/MocA family oxidoreductase [Pirellulaceae bacterium]|nr:Gfo/Idh/MocA family oxidoreductase [Pirellulaceae bacterium]
MTTSAEKNPSGGTGRLNRRDFVVGTGAAAVAFSVIQPQSVRGSQANSKVRFGIVGCGGRGTWITDLFLKHGGYQLVAAADYFQDRVDGLGGKFNVPADKRFTGLACHQSLVEQDLDAVVIQSPPYFHPEQAEAAVDAGKHVYVAKPIAVDVPGCKSIEASGRKATETKRCFLIDFQTRADQYYVECIKRVHEGALGTFAFGESTYHAGIPWAGQISLAKEAPDHPETQLRAWGLFRATSGDIITEQNIHTLDVMSWIMNQPPVCAFGTGGRKVREFGDCFDTFSVTFQYPDNVGVAFSSRQFDGFGTQPEGIRNRMFGTLGVLETSYGGETLIRGKNFYRGGSSPAIYRDGAVANIAIFHDDIQNGRYENPTVPESVRSNLVTILGRNAAYRGEVVYWDDLLKCDERFELNRKGLKT